MCERAVGRTLHTLKIVSDCFATPKMLQDLIKMTSLLHGLLNINNARHETGR